MAKTSKKTSAKSASKPTPKGKGVKSVSAAKVTTPRKTWHDDAKEPKSGSVMTDCINLMRRPGGAGITDFQTVKGFKVSAMTVLRAAERAGYKATATKKEGERTVYKATGSAK